MTSAVFRPKHYSQFTIDPVTFINANGLSFNIGNIVKYVCRSPSKGGIEDLEKAKRYIDIEIETLRRRQRVAAGEPAPDVWKEIL